MNKTKYECKRCKKLSLVKIPNCPYCSSSDGYNKFPDEASIESIIKYNYSVALNNAVNNSGKY